MRSIQRPIHVLLAALLLAPTAYPQADDTVLLRARQFERIAGAPEQALPLYRAIAEESAPGSAAFEEGVLGTVRCLLKLGREDEVEAFSLGLPAVVNDEALAARVRQLIVAYTGAADPGGDVGAGVRIENLVDALAASDASEAEKMLKSLGDLADPYLVRAIRSSADAAVVSHALRLLADRMRADPRATAAIAFFASLDPIADPALTLLAVPFLYSPVPADVYPMLDRCAASPIQDIRKGILNAMAARGGEVGDRYIFDAVGGDMAAKAVFAAIVHGDEELAESVASAVLDHSNPDLVSILLRHSVETGRAGIWRRICVEGNPEVRREAFLADANVQLALTASLPLDERAALVGPFVEVVRQISAEDSQSAATLFGVFQRFEDRGFAQIWFSTPSHPRTLGTIKPLHHKGDLRTYLLDLPLDVSAWRVILGRDGTWDRATLGKIHLSEWFLVAVDNDVDRLIDILRGDDFELPLAARAYLTDAVEQWPQGAPRTRMLLALGEGVPLEQSESVATLTKESNPAVRPFWRQAFVDRGFTVTGLGDGSVRLLFGIDLPETRADLREWLMADIPEGTLNTIFAVMTDGGWAASDLELVERARQVFISTSSNETRRWACRFLNVALKDAELRSLIIATNLPVDPEPRQLAQELGAAAFDGEPYSLADLGDFLSSAPPAIVELGGGIAWSAMDRASDGKDAAAQRSYLLRLLTSPTSVPGSVQVMRRLLELGNPSDAEAKALLDRGQSGHFDLLLPALSLEQILANRERIEQIAHNQHASYRIAALSSLARCVDARAGRVLAEALRDPDPAVPQKARELLESIRLYADEQSRWRRIEQLGLDATTPLAALLAQARDPAPDIRLAAVRALGALGDAEALPHLVDLLRSQDTELRDTAQAAIDLIIANAAVRKVEDGK